jgi:flavin-dependent dehydrogenase
MRAVRVVGAGPAGSAAALTALRQSAPVTIVEKSRLPRHKVCGEFISPEVRGILEKLDCMDAFMALGPSSIRRMTLHFGKRRKHSVLAEPAFGLSRYALDRFLFETAVARGAVSVRETWTESAAVAAQESVVLAKGRKAIAPEGSNRLFGFKAHYIGPVDDAVELFFFDGCYGGVSSVEQGVTNVSGLAPEAMLRACEFNADELVSRSRPLAERLSPLTRKMAWLTVGPLVFSRSFNPVDTQAVYPAGDALGFTDPFTGSGMLNAVLTGSMAGYAAALGVPIPSYLRDCRRALARPFHISAIFRTLLETGLAPWLSAPIPGRWLMQWTRPSGGIRI